MGDGVAHALQIALQIHAAQGGFLLIDEFENGLHYSIQEKVWEMVFALAEELDIQVFATTHSRDCISSFAAVAHRNKATEGMLIRMGRSALKGDNNKVIGTPYTEEELAAALEMSRDVR
jgi:AAA15 family ATPase/GTPase